MGSGAAMRVAGKIGGVVNGSFRGKLLAFPENKTSAGFKASTARSITGVISSSNPLPMVVFGGAPTLAEAKDATFQLSTAFDQLYLSNKSSEGSCESDKGHDKLAISDSVHLEGKACVTKASAPNYAFQAFRLLKQCATVQTAVASIVSDPNIWTAVMKNVEVLEYFLSEDTGMNGSLDESPDDTEIPGHQSHRYSDNETFDEKEPKNGFNSFFEGIKSRVEDMRYSDNETFDEKEPKKGFNSFFEGFKSRVEDMLNRLSSFFQNLFTGSASADGSGIDEKTMGDLIIRLAVMVIMVVVLKRV